MVNEIMNTIFWIGTGIGGVGMVISAVIAIKGGKK